MQSSQKKDTFSACKSSVDCKQCTSRASRERRLKEYFGRDEKRSLRDSVLSAYATRKDIDDEPPKWFKTYMKKVF